MNINNIVAVVDQSGKPINPLINKNGFVKRMIEDGEVEIISRKPVLVIKIKKTTTRTRKLTYTPTKEKLTLGIDYGYKHVGYSVISDKQELVGGTLTLRTDIPDLLKAKSMYRTQRRYRLRFRRPRKFRRKEKGWLPPSIRHDLDSLKKFIHSLTTILPINKIIIETANFDIQKLMNPDIKNVEYQQGQRFNIDGNLREYILYRDGHSCQHKQCKHKKEKNLRLFVHHIVERSNGGSDTPNNLITLCEYCHTPANHKNDYLNPKIMLGNKKLNKSFKSETHMNIIRKYALREIAEDNTNIQIKETFGYITKKSRLEANDEGLEKTNKTHHNDAFFIAGGKYQTRINDEVNVNFLRRNNRSLETFRDAKYIDSRDGKIKSGQELSCQRTTRNKENLPENLRKYRIPINEKGKGKRSIRTKGKRSIRTSRYEIQKGTIIKLTEDYKNFKSGQTLTLGGTASLGKYAYVSTNDGKIMTETKSNGKQAKVLVPTKICKILKNKKGIIWKYE